MPVNIQTKYLFLTQALLCISHHELTVANERERILLTFPSVTPTMATREDSAESQSLLASQQPNYEGAEDVSVEAGNADQPRDIVQVQKTSVWTVIWYTILLTGGILALVFFIKGFIDAGDVDVSLSRISASLI